MRFTGIEKRKILLALTIITISIIIYHIFNNIEDFRLAAISLYQSAFSQIVTGFFIAYLINLVMQYIEGFLAQKTKLRGGALRGTSIALTIVVLLVLFVTLLMFAIPQLTESINRLSQNIDGYVKSVQAWIKAISENYHYQLPDMVVDKVTELVNGLLELVSSGIGKLVEGLYGWVYGTLSSLFGFVVSFALSIYMLIEKEKIIMAFKKVIFSVFSAKTSQKIIEIFGILNTSFSNFLRGQLTEGLILAILAIISMKLLRFEFAVLIGVIVGLTNIIPMFGAFLGGIIGFFILLMVNPVQALWFALFVVVLQQIESNIIYPRVVGHAIGLSGFWIFIAVIVGGGIGGLTGIIIGIPLFTTGQALLKGFIDKRLQENAHDLPQDFKRKLAEGQHSQS